MPRPTRIIDPGRPVAPPTLLMATLVLLCVGAFVALAGSGRFGPSFAAAQAPTAVPPTAVPPAPTAEPLRPRVFAGTLGAFVQVSDGCSHYPLTQCDGSQIEISEAVPGALAPWVGRGVRIDVVYEQCGSGIAGQPLEGPVATSVEPLEAACPQPEACLRLVGRVPNAAVQAALANPAGVMGWLERCNPAVPASPANGLRHNLSLRNPAVPYHPTYNHLVYRCSCP